MPQYFVRYYARTPIALAADRKEQQSGGIPAINFQIDQKYADKVQAFDFLGEDEESGLKIHAGLGVDVLIQESEIDAAIKAARPIAESVLNLLSFATMTECSPARLISAYRYDPQIQEREYLQELPTSCDAFGNVLGTLRSVNIKEIFAPLFVQFNTHTTETIGRAMAFLRKGFNETNLLDEFFDYWIGVEAVQDELNILFPAPINPKSISRRLREWLAERILPDPNRENKKSWHGVKKIFESIGIEKEFGKIRGHRGALIHGKQPSYRLADDQRLCRQDA